MKNMQMKFQQCVFLMLIKTKQFYQYSDNQKTLKTMNDAVTKQIVLLDIKSLF